MMRLGRVLPLGSIALLTSACVDRAYTPAESVVHSPAEPENRLFAIPSHDALFSQWMLPNGNPWAPYAKLTLLSAVGNQATNGYLPDFAELTSVGDATRAASMVASAGLPHDAMWMVDMRGAASIAFASTLSRETPVSVVPTFNNWPAENELVPAEETLAAMIAMPPTPPHDTSVAPPVFVLDSWRLAYKQDDIDESTTDNRYMLTVADFPTAEVLHARGIASVIYVVESLDDVKKEEDDLNDVFVAYRAAGITIHMVDLAWLGGVKPEPHEHIWYSHMNGYVLHCEPRVTVVHDPGFYRRAHGGFGGVHGAPGWGGHSYYGGHGGG